MNKHHQEPHISLGQVCPPTHTHIPRLCENLYFSELWRFGSCKQGVVEPDQWILSPNPSHLNPQPKTAGDSVAKFMLWFPEEEDKNSDQEKEKSIEMGDGQREPEPGQPQKPQVCRHNTTEHVRKWPQLVPSRVSGAMVRLGQGERRPSGQLYSSLRAGTVLHNAKQSHSFLPVGVRSQIHP